MKKRISNLLIASLIIALLTGTASAAFSDVSADAWYADAVEYVNDAGIMVGDDNGNFNPDKPVTRAEMAIVICRVLEMTLGGNDVALPAYPELEKYSDVPETHWANMYINVVSYLKIVNGYGNGRFGPSDTVTYEQAVTMLIRASGAAADAENRGGYPNGFLNAAKDMGLLAGVRASTGEKLSRANVAVLLSNYCHMSLTGDVPSTNNSDNTPGATIGDITQEDQIGDSSENTSDDLSGGSLEIGGSQQEEPPGSGPETGGVGGGT